MTQTKSHQPNIRTCVLTRQKLLKTQLVRLVRLANGQVVLDLNQTQQGRSIYFCARIDALSLIKSRRLITKLLKVNVPDTWYDEIATQLPPT